MPNGTIVFPRVCAQVTGWANDTHCGSQWVSPNLNINFTPANGALNTHRYFTEFYLRGYCPPKEAVLNIRSMGGDNELTGLVVNGHSYTLAAANAQTNDYNPLIGASVITIPAAHLVVGTNTLSITVNNTGLGGPTGFNFCGDLTVTYSNEPSFTLSYNTSQSGYYTVTATPNSSLPPGGSYSWVLEGLDASNNVVFTVSNPSNWWSNVVNKFKDFDHTANSYSNNVSTPLPAGPSLGKFLYGRTYRLSRGVWSADCGWYGTAQTFTITPRPSGNGPQIDVKDVEAPDFNRLTSSATTASVPETDLSGALRIFPNPGTGLFTLSLTDATEGTVDVFDISGKKVQSLRLNAGVSTYRIDLSGYSKGIYVINITAGGTTQSKKVVLE